MKIDYSILSCDTRAHCRACRTSPEWRGQNVGTTDLFPCRHGVTADNLPRPRTSRRARFGPGDAVHALAQATLIGPAFKRILKATGKTCRCNERRAALNRMGWLGLVRAAPRFIRNHASRKSKP